MATGNGVVLTILAIVLALVLGKRAEAAVPPPPPAGPKFKVGDKVVIKATLPPQPVFTVQQVNSPDPSRFGGQWSYVLDAFGGSTYPESDLNFAPVVPPPPPAGVSGKLTGTWRFVSPWD